jgi:homoserine dehydrogenase
LAAERAVRLALLGVGVVGHGVVRVLSEKRDLYAYQIGRPLELAGALVRDASKPRPLLDASLLTADPGPLLDDPRVDIVVELLGGEQPALDYISRALASGKYVVTANKEVMAKHGPSLLALARKHNVDILFEASVGSGIPIIAPLKRDLLANRILSLAAIINGTTNYVLTAMAKEGADFGETLRRAQDLGYAEADPANDVEGEDARYKLAILASLAFRTRVHPDDIYREGITRLSPRDFRYASELGYAIKLLALARAEDGGIQARVHPALVGTDQPLAKVDGVVNAIQVEGDLMGKILFQGPGAGSLPATSAVVADVLDAAQSVIGGRREAHVQEGAEGRIQPIDRLRTRYYIRLTVADRPGVLAQIAAVLGGAEISIASVIQKETFHDARAAELVIMTHEALESSVRGALAEVERLAVVESVGSMVRVEDV